MKKIFIPTYGGGHVNIIKCILPELEKQNVEIEIMALTIADSALNKEKINHNTIAHYIELLPYKEKIKQLGRKAIVGKHSEKSEIAIEDAIAYHGIGIYDLCKKYGEEEAWNIFEENGRKAFNPVYTMNVLLTQIAPDIVVVPTGVRFEQAVAEIANEKNIPVVYINDLPIMPKLPFKAKICVMNEWSKDYAIRISGFNEEDVVITGQPVMEKNLQLQEKKCKEYERIVKGKWKNVVLFLGTPAIDSFPEVKSTIQEIVRLSKKHREIKFIIRPHPGNLDNYGMVSNNNLIVSTEGELKYLIYSSDVIVTQVSTGGFEAVLMGKPVITVLRETKRDFMLEDTGGAINLEDIGLLEENILQCLCENSDIKEKLLKGKINFSNKKNAAQNITDVVMGLLG